jgi:hypothetical protein
VAFLFQFGTADPRLRGDAVLRSVSNLFTSIFVSKRSSAALASDSGRRVEHLSG